jgi:hypothetical protein
MGDNKLRASVARMVEDWLFNPRGRRPVPISPLKSKHLQAIYDAPERTRTSTDHSVHKALNLIPPALMR